MGIPDFQTLMLPLLRYTSDGAEHKLPDALEALAKEFELSEEDLKHLLPSGKAKTVYNRVAWAKVYLCRAGLLDSPRRGVFLITEQGKDILKKAPSQIDIKFLHQFPGFQRFQQKNNKTEIVNNVNASETEETATPEETLAKAHQQLTDEVANELLGLVKNCSPYFFEKLVVELLVKMGYGGSHGEVGKAIGKSGDEGIDGVINEDKLGLDMIYIQAKRWADNNVGRPEIQKFVGALHGKQSKKGVFITTSSFSKGAREYAEKVDSKVVLIDGEYLAQLMIGHNVGVSTVESYEIKKIDSDYFIED